jgi:hypothetical protein
MADYRPEVERQLRDGGCYFKRTGKGDHSFWYSPITNKSFPVDHKILSRHTANGIMKQAGLAHRFR